MNNLMSSGTEKTKKNFKENKANNSSPKYIERKVKR
jgi:hypothetical protein